MLHRSRTGGALAIALTLAACAGPPPAGPIAETPANRDDAWRICQDPNRGLAAVDACTSLLQAGTESPQRQVYLHYNRGMELSRRGRTADAIADYDAALKLDPGFALALYQRGLLYQAQGQTVLADLDLMRARQLNPRLP